MDMWVFGYGSLLWNPGFEYDQTRLARLNGYRRSFCMRSIHHRGTIEDPGLVLALDEQAEAHCDGLAFRVRDGHQDQTLAYLRERELISSAYVEKTVTLVTEDGEIPALFMSLTKNMTNIAVTFLCVSRLRSSHMLLGGGGQIANTFGIRSTT